MVASHQAASISARSCAMSNKKILRPGPRKNSKISRRNPLRIALHSTCRCSATSWRTSEGGHKDVHHQAASIAAQSRASFRTKNYAAAKKIRKFRSEIRCESRAISPLLACRRSAQLLRTSEGRGEAARHQAARISARSRVISCAAAKKI